MTYNEFAKFYLEHYEEAPAGEAGFWIEVLDGDLFHLQQVIGQSGTYLVATDVLTGEVIRDESLWQE